MGLLSPATYAIPHWKTRIIIHAGLSENYKFKTNLIEQFREMKLSVQKLISRVFFFSSTLETKKCEHKNNVSYVVIWL